MILRISLSSALLFLCIAPSFAQQTTCVDGMAGGYPCESVDLKAVVSIEEMGGNRGTDANDIWGWTDPVSGKEYALVGLSNGTAFVDISTADKPVYLGNLATHTTNSAWRDIKVFKNHAFIVSEASGHGMQVFDLTQLASVTEPPATFTATAHYGGFGNAHNIVINEETGYAYAVGASTCSGGLDMIDINDPLKPVAAGCFSQDGYTHDAQCVVYNGPDVDYQGHEICFNSNEDTVTIADVTNKNNPIQLARVGYPNSAYVHQGWLTEDQRYFYQNDELDENGSNTRTMIWDVADLDDPFVKTEYFGETKAIDHNLYIKGNYVYESNYTAGLRILDISDVLNPVEVAYFDTYPSSNSNSFFGAWSSYPYFKSGNVIINSIQEGLFIVTPDLPGLPVDLVAFNAVLDGSDVVLQWQTASETNNAGFDVEQLVDGQYSTIGFVAGQGTTELSQNYTHTVSNLGPGIHAFRLKQVDFDGAFEYSDVVSVVIGSPESVALSQAYPNPFNPMTVVSLSVARTQRVRVEAFNYQGQQVGLLFDGLMEENLEREVRFDAGQLPSGFYIIRATGEFDVATQSVTLVK